MSWTWRRPDSVPVGQIWSQFQGRERNGVPAKMYQVRDMEAKHKDRCIQLMLKTFLADEPLCKALDIYKDEEGIKSILGNWEDFVSQNVSLACFTEVEGEPDELVGFNILYVKSIDDPEEDYNNVKGVQWRKLLKTINVAEELVDVFKHYDVEVYLSSSGLTVLPEHRGQNIGARIFEAREPLCKALGIKASATVFTATTSQVLAKKCGYELLATLEYKHMLQYGIDLSRSDTPIAEVRGIKFR